MSPGPYMTGVTVPALELQKLREVETEVRALLRALRVEAQPGSHLAESIVTQHHISRLTELVGS